MRERAKERGKDPLNLMIISLCRNNNSPWSALLTWEYSATGSSGAWRENRARHPVSGSGECRGRCRSTRCTQVPGRWTGQGHSFLGHTGDPENSEQDDKDPVTNKVRVKLLVSDKTTLIFSFTYSIIISSTPTTLFLIFLWGRCWAGKCEWLFKHRDLWKIPQQVYSSVISMYSFDP